MVDHRPGYLTIVDLWDIWYQGERDDLVKIRECTVAVSIAASITLMDKYLLFLSSMAAEVMHSDVMYNWLRLSDLTKMKCDFIAVMKPHDYDVYYVFFKRLNGSIDYKCIRNYPHRGYQGICDDSEPLVGKNALDQFRDYPKTKIDMIRFYPTNYTLSDEDRPLFSKELTMKELEEVAHALYE